MQKLAVALTTQEEFNEFSKFIERLWIDPSTISWVWRDKTCVNLESWARYQLRDWYKANWYKIISLKEAIGEKENKEIIREGEARGFEPKTGDKIWASNCKNVWNKVSFVTIDPTVAHYKYVCTWDDTGWLNWEFKCNTWKYIKPIEEPKRDWIDGMIKEMDEEGLIVTNNSDPIREFIETKYIREAIEKHIPKINYIELDNITIDNHIHSYAIRDLLKSKWLLSE